MSVAERAAEVLSLSAVDPERARVLAEEVQSVALAGRDWLGLSLARRAGGVAALQLGRLDVAIEQLQGAIAAGKRGGSRQMAGEARMSLAAALMQKGSTTRGLAAIHIALTELRGPAAARGRVERAAISQGLGRDEAALDDLRLALPVLRRSGDVEWEVRALSNRSSMYAARRQFRAAKADLVRAGSLCEEHGLTLGLAYVEHNLGWLDAERGDVPSALEHLDNAGTRYTDLGMEVGSLHVDRSSVLLSVRLLTEARGQAEAAVRTLSDQQRTLELPEAQLMLSTVALLQEDAPRALSAAEEAVAGCLKLGRREWLPLARYARLQAQVQLSGQLDRSAPSAPRGEAVTARRLRTAAQNLEKAGWSVPALEARLLAGQVALREGKLTTARADYAVAAKARRSGPADARSRAWLAEALLREAEGSRRGAKSALRAGLRVLADYRASLGATELRAHVSVHRGSLARAGLRLALQDADAQAVHWWSECGRASADLLRPVRPPVDRILADQLQDLRTTMAEIDQGRSAGSSTTRLVARQVQLERAIRDRARRSVDGWADTSQGPPTTADLAVELRDAVLVEYVQLGRQFAAVTVIDGRTRLHRLGDPEPIRHAVDHLSFALRRLARTGIRPAQEDAAATVLDHSAGVLDAALLQPLTGLGDRPLVIVPAGWLQSVPWSVLPRCVGRPVSVAPSASLWRLACSRLVDRSERVVSIAGPRLANAEAEAARVAGLYPRTGRSLLGNSATSSAVAEAMNGARLAHVAAHSTVRADNPLFSSLLLADGPFTVYDLERLGRTPQQVILAACNSALSHVTAGEEILGLSAALLNQHTATLVASVVPVPDAETLPLMSSYHELLRSGVAPAAALAEAQERHRGDNPRARVSAAGFVCLGVGHGSRQPRRLATRPRKPSQEPISGAGDVDPVGADHDARAAHAEAKRS